MSLEKSPYQLEYEFLSYLAKAGGPVGATTLVLVLGKTFSLSQATIGRKLMEFDLEGYTSLEGRKGRVITEAGRRRLAELEKQLNRHQVNSRLLKALNEDRQGALLDVLVARRALERETAGLAAERVTEEDIRLLQGSIAKQNAALAEGRIPYEEDKSFHMLIARISGNLVLLHALELVWQEAVHLPATADIRKSVGGVLAVDHRNILDAIAKGSRDAAADAMTGHIDHLIQDVYRYCLSQREEPADNGADR